MKTVADCIHESWERVFKMRIMEFLNILCFVHDDVQEEKRRQDEYMRKLKRS